ncbi:hypothetical protein VU07_00795 [Desulfobulbus sp. F4]|nr:hypothetical protein [Desulfobulbus sp. F4]
MKFSTLFKPMHQGHQKLISPAQFRRPAKIAQPLLNNLEHNLEHFGEGRTLNTCRTLKILITQILHIFVSHSHKVHGLVRLMQEVY